MASIKLPAYLKWRDGHPRWEPGPLLRAAKFKGRDLKDEAGRWLSLEAAIAAAQLLNEDVAEWRVHGKRRLRPAAPISHERTCRLLAEKYYASADFTRLAPNTQADYRRKLAIFLASDFGDAPVLAVTTPQLVGYWQELYDTRGHAMANGIKATISALFTFAKLTGWRGDGANPAHDLRRPKLPPRVAIWLPERCEAFVAMADEIGYPEVGDAVMLALHTSQRLSDILAMPLSILGDRIRLTQMKRGALYDAPVTPALAARIRALRDRRLVRNVLSLDALAIVDVRGQKHDRFSFNKAFRAVRAAVLLAHPEMDRAERFAPGISELTFQDLRDTAITRLALAGCTLIQIAAITGHKPAHITGVIEHYLAINPAMADAAIERLIAWLDGNRIAV